MTAAPLLSEGDLALALEGYDDKRVIVLRKLERCESLITAAEASVAQADHNAARALQQEANEAARDLLEQIPAVLGRAAAIAYTANHEFPASGPTRNFLNLLDHYGPFGRLAHMLKGLDWPDGTRPSWSMKNPGHATIHDPVPGIKDLIAQVRAEVEA